MFMVSSVSNAFSLLTIPLTFSFDILNNSRPKYNFTAHFGIGGLATLIKF